MQNRQYCLYPGVCAMLISGTQKLTILDYPEKTACIVFTPGCNFRCGYCHNPEFVLPEELDKIRSSFIPEDIFFSFLEKRRGLLDAVVISGGEPTLMPDLLEFMKKIKERGFAVKLDTNGNRPEVLEQAIDQGLVDYVAMDVKTSLSEYPALVGNLVNPEYIKKSVDLLKQGVVHYEFRTTLIQEIHSWNIFQDMTNLLSGARLLYLQTFRPACTLNPLFQEYHPFAQGTMEDIALFFQKEVHAVYIR